MNRWKVKYTALLNLNVIQKFYENNVCGHYTTEPMPDLVFVPATETELLMRRLDFIFKSNPYTGGFTVVAATDGTPSPNYRVRFYPKKGEKLTFFMLLKNPDLLNFSNLPTTTDAGKIFYFNNKISGNPALRSDPLYLTQTAAGVNGVADRVKKSGSSYTYHHANAVVTAKVKHQLTGVELAPVSLNNLDVGAGCDLSFNLTGLPLGKVELTIDGAPIETFYYTGDNAPASLFAAIEFDLSDVLDPNYRLIEHDHSLLAPPPAYFIQFNTRPTTWRYTFKLTASSPLYNEISDLVLPETRASFLGLLKIVSNDSSITFSQSSPDDKTIIFESDNPLTLQEKYTVPPGQDRLKLILTKYTGVPLKETAVKDNLPYPLTSMIDARNPSMIYSDIFLTL